MRESQKVILLHGLALVTLTILINIPARAQIHYPNTPANRDVIIAEEQYQQGHYAVAEQSATRFLTSDSLTGALPRDFSMAKYYQVLSALKLNEPGCDKNAIRIISTTPDPAYRQRLAYALGQYYFGYNQLTDAIAYYEIAGIANLTNREIVDEKFELAYCYFNSKQFDKAEPLFASIKELQEGEYYIPGNYYYGLLAYNESKYPEALQSFDRVKDDIQYRSIVPYYIAEIHYFMGNKEKALSYATDLLKRPDKLFYDNDLHLLVAQCLFEDEHYSDALPYFEFYYEHTDKISKEDLYEMAYCYYTVSSWNKAIDKFKQLSDTRDSLGQSSMYLLGDCYLKTGDKQSARNAFGICADMPFNPGQQEAAMMLHAKLSYEMGYNDVAATQLSNLIVDFPNSQYLDEAKTMLSVLFVKTNNFAGALRQLDEVVNKGKIYWEVYQKVIYDYAVQQFNENNIEAADSFFTLSLSHPSDPTYEAAAYFWKGEIAYRLHNYDNVITDLGHFLERKGYAENIKHLSPTATLQHAYVTLGFASMENKNYGAARDFFAQAKELHTDDAESQMVATVREADAVFMQKDFAGAIDLYDKIIAKNGEDADYARYQKGILLGLLGKNTEKIALLQTLVSATPPSSYATNARYEMALAYMETDNYTAAITTLQPLTETFDGKDIASKAWMKIGFAYQQLFNVEKAIESYRHIVTEYTSSEERPAALEALRSLYIEKNQPEAYTQLLKDNNISTGDNGNIESTYYSAAEAQFAAAKYDKARDALNNYFNQYPNGAYNTKAHYYRGESNYQLKKYEEAKADFDAVLHTNQNDFTENSQMRIAEIALNSKDYTVANSGFHALRDMTNSKENIKEAYTGLMISSFYLGKFDESTLYADSLTFIPDLNKDLLDEAVLYKARSMQHFDKNEDAMTAYEQLKGSGSSEISAESRYHIAEIKLQQGNLKEAEAAANETIKKSAGNDYWIVKSYILLADVFVKSKDYFNAKATLQSVVKNTANEELKKEAATKLEEVKGLEKQKSKLSE